MRKNLKSCLFLYFLLVIAAAVGLSFLLSRYGLKGTRYSIESEHSYCLLCELLGTVEAWPREFIYALIAKC